MDNAKFTLPELAAILCGLRLAQLHADDDWSDETWREIASSGDEVAPLTPDEIDALCERLNAMPVA